MNKCKETLSGKHNWEERRTDWEDINVQRNISNGFFSRQIDTEYDVKSTYQLVCSYCEIVNDFKKPRIKIEHKSYNGKVDYDD